MTSYLSPLFLFIFLPLVIIIYTLTKQKYRWIILLLSSLVFFWFISGYLVIYIIISSFSVHHIGIWLSSIKRNRDEAMHDLPKEEKKKVKNQYLKKQRLVVFLGVIIQIGILIVLKYTNFFLENTNSLLSLFGINFQFNMVKFLLPIGISFYTLQAVSYIFDVYRDKIKADYNLFRIMLYLSFFPQIMEGPISRYSDTAEKLYSGEKIVYNNLCFSAQRIAYGIMKKSLVADRVNVFVSEVFTNYSSYDGGIIALAAILYTVQLYMDFSGMMDIAIGIGQIFGINLPENFKQPFFSKTISEFWTRWHITLGTWFKDYIFYPLSLSKPLKNITSKCRKKIGNYYGPLVSGTIALFCVWLCNGLWHGAAWTYIFFGMYHFIFILMGNLFEPLLRLITNKTHIKRTSKIYICLQIIKTTVIVIFGELFFRAISLNAGFFMVGKIFTNFTFKNFGKLKDIGLPIYDLIVLLVAILIVFVISILKERNIKIREFIAKRNIAIRWSLYIGLVVFILVFGAYGAGYVPVDPMYANF